MTRKKCKVCGDVAGQYTLFLFPTDVERRRVWSEFCHADVEPRKSYYLCSQHFEKNCIITRNQDGQRTRLRKNANPSIRPTKIVEPQNVNEFGKYKQPKLNSGVRKCLLCKKNTDLTIPLFRFPSKPEISRQWLIFCNLNENEAINPNWRLCSRHFSQELLVCGKSGKIRLLPNSTPSIKLEGYATAEQLSEERQTVGVQSTEFIKLFTSTMPKQDKATSRKGYPTIVSISATNLSQPINVEVSSSAEVRPHTDSQVPGGSVSEINTSSLINTEMTSLVEVRSHIHSQIPAPVDISISESSISSLINTETIFSAEVKSNTEPQMNTPSTICKRKFRSPRYAGDIKTPDMETPRRRKKYLSMMKNELSKNRKQIKELQIENARLRARIMSMKQLTRHLVDEVCCLIQLPINYC